MKLPLSNTLSNQQIAPLFSFISQVLGMDPQNRFKARAYEEGAVVISHLDYELSDLFSKLQKQELNSDIAASQFLKQLDALPGIGEAISHKLLELFTTGTIAAFQEYVKDLPGGMYPLMQIHGIGAKKALSLATQFNLTDPETAIADLLAKAKQGAIKDLPGFGEKSEQDLITALEERHQKARIPYAEALQVANQFKKALEKSDQILRIAFLGSLRREAATVGDIDLGVAAKDPKLVVADIKKFPFVYRVLAAGDQLVSVIGKSGWQIDIKFAPLTEWGSFIQHFTGDKQHNIKLREFALKKGFSLSEHGIKIKGTDEQKKFSDEEEFYHFLGLKLIPPTERVGGQELEKYKNE